MKKSVLLIIATGVCAYAMAQNAPSPAPQSMSVPPVHAGQMQKMNDRNSVNGPFLPAKSHLDNSHRVQSSRIPLGSSYNAYGYLDANTTAITANQACKLIVVTHREDASKPSGTYGTGSYEASFSTNYGTSWDSDIVVLKAFQSGSQGSRYPNGVIFCPAGDTNAANTYDAFAGPWTNGTNWAANVGGSIRLDSMFDREDFWPNGVAGIKTENNGDLGYMQSCDDSTVHVIGEGFNYNGSNYQTRYLGAVITTGKFVNDSFHWTQQVIKPHFWNAYYGALSTDPVDSGNGTGAGYACQHIGPAGMAWSQDGSTGYVVFLGNLDSAGLDYVSYQPIVYKSTDHGNTWNMMAPFNYSTLPNLVQYIYHTSDDTNLKLPLIGVLEGGGQGSENDYDLTVDKDKNLHIFCSVTADFYSNPDSAYWPHWYKAPYGNYYIYDLYTTSPTGGWNARFIDSLHATPGDTISNSDWSVNTGTSPYTYVAYGARIQASRTTNGEHIFCMWEDDIQGDPQIIQPDIFGQSYDVNTATASPVHQFTNDGREYFMCASNIALESKDTLCPNVRYTVPCFYVQPQSAGNDGTSPVNLFYQNDVIFVCDSNFASAVHDVTPAQFTVSPNYPNPFNKTTEFNVTLPEASAVSVDVFNMLGQKVWTMTPARMGAGVNVISINGSALSPGVYFYRVTVNDSSITQKMVIE